MSEEIRVEQEEMDEISLFELWEGIRKRLGFIILLGIVFGALAYAYSNFVATPQYQARGTLIVGRNENQQQPTNDINTQDLDLSRRLVDTYTVIMQSRSVQDRVIEDLNLNLTPGELTEMTSVSALNDTEVIEVRVTDIIPERAMDIANQTMEVFQQEIQDIMQVDNVQILDPATLPEDPVSPNIPRNTILGVLIGLILGAAIAVFKEITDTTIKSANDVKKVTDLPIIGQIPYTKEARGGR